VVDTDFEQDRLSRQERDAKHALYSRKVLHRHSRSSSRARSSSAKAREEIKEVDHLVKDTKRLSL